MRKVALGVAAVAVVCVLLVAAGPLLLSTGAGRSLAESFISGRISGSVQLDALGVSWTGRQSVEGLTLRDADGTVVLLIERMENDRSLLTLAREWREDLGTTTITGLRADLTALPDGTTNLTGALSSRNPKKAGQTGFVPVIPFARLEMSESRIAVSAPDVEEVEFLLQELFFEMPRAGKPAELRLAASTRQGELTGELKAAGKVENLVDEEGHLQPVLARVDLTVEAGNLPVEGIDRALGYRGQLAAALGKKLDLQVRTRAALDGFDVDLGVAAPHFSTTMKAALAGGSLVLTEEAEARFTVTPLFVETVARVRDPESVLSLEKAAPLTMTIEKMSIPFGTFDPGRTAFQGTLTAAQPLRFTGSSGDEELEIQSLQARVESSKLARRVDVDVVSSLRRAGSPGKVRARAAMEGLFDGDGRFQPEKARADIDAELSNVPSSLLDGAVGGGGLLVELLGDAVDMSVSVQSEGAEMMDLLFSVESPRFKGTVPLRITDTLSLSAPAKVQATLRPDMVKYLQPDGEGARLGKNTVVSLAVTEFSSPRPGGEKPFPDPRQTSFKALLEAEDFSLVPGGGNEIAVGGLALSVQADTLDDMRISLKGTVDAGDGMAGDFLGEGPAGVSLDARTGMVPGGEILPVTGEVRISGTSLQAKTAFTLRRPYSHLQLTSPLEAEVSLSRALLARLYPTAPGGIGVSPPVAVSLKLSPGEYPVAGGESGALSARLEAKVPVLTVTDGQGKPLAAANDVSADVEFDGPAGILKGQIRGKATLPGGGRSGSLEGDFTVRDFKGEGAPAWKGATLEGRYRAKALPTALLALLPGMSPGVLAVAGEEIDAEGEINLAPLVDGQGGLGIRATSRTLKLDAALSLGKGITLERPARISVTLDAESYAALTGGGEKGGGDSRFVLKDKAVIHATVDELRWPRGEGGGSPAGKAAAGAVRANLTAEDLLFRDTKEKRLVGLEGLRLDISGTDIGREVDIDLSGRISGGAGKDGAGSLTASIVLTDLLGRDGSFRGAGLGMKANVKGEAVPVALVDDWLRLKGLGTVALGRLLGLEAEVNVKGGSGPITFSARADNASLEFSGSLKNGVLRMTRPLVGELTVTEELGKRLLNKIHPIFETVSTSREPLRVEVAAEGFSLPVSDFHIRKAVVPSIRIASNRLVLKKGGMLDFLIPLAQSFGGMKGIGQGGETEVWFTTLNAGLRGGVFEYRNRVDMLIDGKLHAVSWGSVNLAGAGAGGDESSYDLFLGLPAGSLHKVLGTKKISEDEVLVIPLRGEEGGMDLKKTFTLAGLDLGRVRGQYEVARKNPLLGLVVGQLAGEITGVKKGVIPPPSMTPLPWAHLVEEETTSPAPPPAPAPREKAAPPPEPSRPEEKSPEDALREALPDEMKGVFDLLRKKR